VLYQATLSPRHHEPPGREGGGGGQTHGHVALRGSVGEAHAGLPNSIDTARPNSPGATVGGTVGATVGAGVLGASVGAIVFGGSDVGALVVGGNDGASGSPVDCAHVTAALQATTAIAIAAVRVRPMTRRCPRRRLALTDGQLLLRSPRCWRNQKSSFNVLSLQGSRLKRQSGPTEEHETFAFWRARLLHTAVNGRCYRSTRRHDSLQNGAHPDARLRSPCGLRGGPAMQARKSLVRPLGARWERNDDAQRYKEKLNAGA
jgi:hypothetical protein